MGGRKVAIPAQRNRGAPCRLAVLMSSSAPMAAGAFPPLAINIERQLTFAEPMLSLKAELEVVRNLPGVLSASVALGFPYADIEDMGSAFVVVTDNEPELAQTQADGLAKWLLDNRERFRGEMISAEDAMARIEAAPTTRWEQPRRLVPPKSTKQKSEEAMPQKAPGCGQTLAAEPRPTPVRS